MLNLLGHWSGVETARGDTKTILWYVCKNFLACLIGQSSLYGLTECLGEKKHPLFLNIIVVSLIIITNCSLRHCVCVCVCVCVSVSGGGVVMVFGCSLYYM